MERTRTEKGQRVFQQVEEAITWVPWEYFLTLDEKPQAQFSNGKE